jgi:hypothetical protein
VKETIGVTSVFSTYRPNTVSVSENKMRKVHFSKQTGTAALFQNYTACLRERSSRTLETANFAD